MEINPEHPATKASHDNWHKIAALLMRQMEKDKTIIPVSAIEQMNQDDICIAVRYKDDGIHLELMTNEQGMRLMEVEALEHLKKGGTA